MSLEDYGTFIWKSLQLLDLAILVDGVLVPASDGTTKCGAARLCERTGMMRLC